MNSWKNRLNQFAIRPMQKFSYTTGKNSTDSALIIDAMDIMHAKLVEGICIVSSDSDYTGLANRLREEGFFVMGIGKAHTPEAFVKSCENFIYTEVLTPAPAAKTAVPAKQTEGGKATQTAKPLINKITNQPIDITLIDNAFQIAVNDLTGLATAGVLGSAIRKIDSSFDPRNFGYYSFKKFLEALKPKYEIIVNDKGTLFVKRKE
jgi:hypothetical protein